MKRALLYNTQEQERQSDDQQTNPHVHCTKQAVITGELIEIML